MKERPILFNGEMVRAILDGRKTQTRRAIKLPPPETHQWHGWVVESSCRKDEGKACWAAGSGPRLKDAHRVRCPYGQPGDRLWVRETHHVPGGYLEAGLVEEIRGGISTPESLGITYRAGAPAMTPCDGGWTPSIHMPRWASRITLEIIGVRVERLQEISEADAMAEGCRAMEGCKWHTFEEAKAGIPMHEHTAKDAFHALWESINGAGSWEANPWVWVVEFRRFADGQD